MLVCPVEISTRIIEDQVLECRVWSRDGALPHTRRDAAGKGCNMARYREAAE